MFWRVLSQGFRPSSSTVVQLWRCRAPVVHRGRLALQRSLQGATTFGQVMHFRTSAPRRAGWLILTPIARIGAAIAGRLGRSWWKRLTPERRAAIRAAIAKRKRYIYGGLALASGGGAWYYASHVEETPITGRRRFMMFSKSDVAALVEAEKEELLQMVLAGKTPLPASDPTYQHVLSIVTAIISKNWSEHFEGINWKLIVIDNPDIINAICLPSGEVFVFSGLLKACKNDNELAFILSHEMAHAVLGHGAEGLSHKGIVNFLSMFLIAAIWAIIPNDLVSYFLHRFSSSTTEYLFEYPYSRELENEADKVGLMFAANACYDPGEAAKVWTHLSNENVSKDAEFLYTHPSSETR